MRVSELKGSEEIKRDVAEIRWQFLENIPPEDRLEGLGPQELARALKGLGVEDRLKGLGPKEKAELLALLLAEREKQ